MNRIAPLLFSALMVACGSSLPTAPTNARMTLAISQATLPIGGTALVTATILESNGTPAGRVTVSFSGSLGTFDPVEAQAIGGVATSTFTARTNGTGMIGAVSGSVAAERIQVQVGELPKLPEINTTPAAPTIALSCNSGVAGVPAICSVSGSSSVKTLSIMWGDSSPEQSLSPTVSSIAHVFPRGGSYTVIARAEDGLGRVAHASSTAAISDPPPPPPPVTPPTPTFAVFMSQEQSAGASGCAAFYVGATAAPGNTITSIAVTGAAVPGSPFTGSSARFAICGLTKDVTILTATATDSSGANASYQLIVR